MFFHSWQLSGSLLWGKSRQSDLQYNVKFCWVSGLAFQFSWVYGVYVGAKVTVKRDVVWSSWCRLV